MKPGNHRNMRVKIKLYTLFVLIIVTIRVAVCEIFMVDSPSMIPAIMPTEIYCVDKVSGGAILPRRFAEIPVINVFTWNRTLREMDERMDWGLHRMPRLRDFQVGDVILFREKDGGKNVLVKRIDHIVYDRGKVCYYVLGDNRSNSTDSRHFGPIPDSLVIGRARHVLFSWDNEAEGLKKFRWRRIGHDISESKGP